MLTEACRTTHSAIGLPLADRDRTIDRTDESGEPVFVTDTGPQSLAVSAAPASMQGDILQHAYRLFFDRVDRGACSTSRAVSLFPALLDIAHLEKNSRREKRLEVELWTLFEAEPLEDGLNHPAEKTVREVLQSTDKAWALRWLKSLALDTSHPAFAASVLRCLGRQERPGTVVWRVEIVRTALATDNVEMRDAAAQVAEAWGGSDMRRVLLAHSEPESWLRNYIEKIVEDLVT